MGISIKGLGTTRAIFMPPSAADIRLPLITQSAYRYLRINVSVNNGDLSNVQISEIKWFVDAIEYPTVAMTAATTGVLVASASTEVNPAWKAFDDAINYWEASATTGWIKLDLGAGNEILPTSCKIIATAIANAAKAPQNFTLEGSNTGAFAGEEAVMKIVTGEITWTDYEEREFII